VAAVTYAYTNMNEGTNLIKTRRLHEKHAVATWSIRNHLSIRLWTDTGKSRKSCAEMGRSQDLPDMLTFSEQSGN
jgi:hypothetical protein